MGHLARSGLIPVFITNEYNDIKIHIITQNVRNIYRPIYILTHAHFG